MLRGSQPLIAEQITMDALKRAVWLLRHEELPPNTLKVCRGAWDALRADPAILMEAIHIGPKATLFGLSVWIVADRFPGDRFFEVIHVGKRPEGLF